MSRILVNTWRREGEVFGPVLRDMFGVEVQYAQSLQRAGAQVYLTPQPEPGTDPAEIVRGFDGLLVAHIAAKRQHVPSGSLQLGLRSCILLRIGSPNGDVGTRLGQCLRHAETDAAIAAGDQRHSAGEIERSIRHVRAYVPSR